MFLSAETLSNLLNQCSNTLKHLKAIHTHLIKSPDIPKSDLLFLITRLLFFSALSSSPSTHSLNHASKLFHSIDTPDLYIYNIMIRAHATRFDRKCSSNMKSYGYKSCFKAIVLYRDMIGLDILPDCITFPFVIKACASWGDIGIGRAIHGHVVKFGFGSDLFVNNSLISMYSVDGLGGLDCAQRLFDEMLNKDVVSWNSMIVGYLRSGDFDEAVDLFRRMERRSVFSWNSIIAGFVHGGRPKEALEFFQEMQCVDDGKNVVGPDKFTLASVLSACASLGALDHGKWVHNYLKRSGQGCDVVLGTSLIDMYGKCGSVEKAFEVFRNMPEKDTLAWTAMISAFALNGCSEEALNLFEEMETLGVKPNHVTFVGVLSACAHSGLVEKGRWFFDVMDRVYLIEQQVYHYACMVDILSRAGLFEEAERLIENMPMEADVYVLGALLGGCQMHGNVELGERIAKYLIDLEPLNHVYYVNLCDLYAKSGRYESVKAVRALMQERGIKKEVPGCSAIEIDGVVLEFSVRGLNEVRTEELILVLTQLGDEMKNNELQHLDVGSAM